MVRVRFRGRGRDRVRSGVSGTQAAQHRPILLVWHSTEVVAYISLPALPFFSSLLASAVSSHPSIEETLSARLSKLENYGFDQLVSQRD